MAIPNQAHPAIYTRLREQAFVFPRPSMRDADPSIPHVVLMDWIVSNGSVTVLAVADGTASVYLSSGGGFIGGSESHPSIRKAALHAVNLAAQAVVHALQTGDRPLPAAGDVSFYFINARGVFVATVAEASLKTGKDPLGPLGGAMQNIVTQYRLSQRQ